MKKIIVITASLLFTALVVLGGSVEKSYQQTQPEQVNELEFIARLVEQQLVLDFEVTPSNNLRVELYDLTGKRIGFWRVDEVTKEVILDNQKVLQQGLYIVKVTDGRNSSVKKFKI